VSIGAGTRAVEGWHGRGVLYSVTLAQRRGDPRSETRYHDVAGVDYTPMGIDFGDGQDQFCSSQGPGSDPGTLARSLEIGAERLLHAELMRAA